jgi:L-alanine-DL-glutamate epimerase-like enolase superfamily enzyme
VKIEAVECRPLEAPLPGYTGGTYALASRRTVQCRITTDDGVSSNICVGNDSTYGSSFWAAITGPFKELLIGQDPLTIGRQWSNMMSHAAAGYIDRAEVIKAVSTLDIALWDLKGQILGQPLYKLLGGVRHAVPIIAIGGYYETSTHRDGIAEEVERCKQVGMAGIKFKVGGLSLAEDAERVVYLRKYAGDDFAIVVDSNMAWTPTQSLEFMQMIDGLGVAWLEEPVHWSNQMRGLRAIKQGSIPLAAGQSELSVFGCFELLAQECVDVINVTSNRGGGVTGWMKLAGAAELVDVRMAHVAEPHISMHLMAGIPNGTFVECYPDPRRDPFWSELYKDRPRVEDGEIFLPDTPGLGVTLNEDAADFYAKGAWV